MAKTFLFYDIETSGLNKSFDQVLQFAAIRTDLALNELAHYEFLIKLNPDVIPSPYALLTHGITLEELTHGICEYEAMQQIHQLLNEPGTISLGYNTLGFDDEFLRFSFYRNLLPSYTHQFANECSRMDLYPMTIMYYLYKPEVLSWPMLEGKPSFKLEQLNFANNLWLDGKAHNAMVDVQVTLALAKKLMQAPEVWQYLIQYFDKDSDSQRISKLPFNFKTALSEHQECFIIDCDFGKTANYQCPVISLGPHTYYKNQTLWLRLDRPELSDTTLENIPANTWAVKKKYGEPGFLLPKLPRFLKNTSDEYQLIVEANKCWLQENPEILQAISHYHRHYTYPKIPNIDVDAALYQNGFLSPEDEKLCREFHQADLEKKSQLLPLFFNKNLQQQAIRVLARNYPEHLPENFKLGFQTYLQQLHIDNEETAIRDYRNKKHLTPNAAQAEIDTIKNDKTLNESELKILNELEDYLKNF